MYLYKWRYFRCHVKLSCCLSKVIPLNNSDEMPIPSPVLPPRSSSHRSRSTPGTSAGGANQSSRQRHAGRRSRRHRHHRPVARQDQLSTIDEEHSWENRSSLGAGNSEPSVISVSVNPEVVISPSPSGSAAGPGVHRSAYPPVVQQAPPVQPPPYSTAGCNTMTTMSRCPHADCTHCTSGGPSSSSRV